MKIMLIIIVADVDVLVEIYPFLGFLAKKYVLQNVFMFVCVSLYVSMHAALERKLMDRLPLNSLKNINWASIDAREGV